MVKCYIALAESEDGLKGKGKVFLDKDNIRPSYRIHTNI